MEKSDIWYVMWPGEAFANSYEFDHAVGREEVLKRCRKGRRGRLPAALVIWPTSHQEIGRVAEHNAAMNQGVWFD